MADASSVDTWQIDKLDLDAYLLRIGVRAHPPSRAALDELYQAHLRSFTFDNIDVLLDQHPGVSLDAVQGKFVGRGRGGYCFEHCTLFAAVLERLGYTVQRRLGRVGDPTVAARTHCVAIVDLDGRQLIVDPGFGLTVLRPIERVDGAEESHGGWRYRVRAVSPDGVPAWELQRYRDDAWERMHTHDDSPVRPVDLAVGHHYTSSHPPSHFRHGLMLTGYQDDRHISLTHRTITVRRPGQPTEHREVEPEGVREGWHELQVPLTRAEEERLLAKIVALRAGDTAE